jgi:hypothetical protein
MSHHFGETLVKAAVLERTFTVEMGNHQNETTVTLNGPVQGIFENRQRKITKDEAERLGREVAHLLARFFGG